MTAADILLLLKKIVIGLLPVLIPFCIFYGALWLVSHFG
jgi:hypothetical protein